MPTDLKNPSAPMNKRAKPKKVIPAWIVGEERQLESPIPRSGRWNITFSKFSDALRYIDKDRNTSGLDYGPKLKIVHITLHLPLKKKQ